MTMALLALTLFSQTGQDWIEFTMVEGFPVTFTDNACGIQALYSSIILSDPVSDSFYVCNSSGVLINKLAITPGCSDAYGICWTSSGGNEAVLFNDTSSTYLWRFNSDSTWTFFSNPAGNHGRELGIDGVFGLYWQAAYDGSNSVWRHLGDGTAAFQYPITQVSGEISGITSYPYGSDAAIVVSGLTDDCFHVYHYHLGLLTYLGSGSIPDTDIDCSLAIDYDYGDDFFWWLYRKGGNLFLAKLQGTIEQALEPGTWGEIKLLGHSEEPVVMGRTQQSH
jgi:hypothetical protein